MHEPAEASLIFPDSQYWASYIDALREGFSDGGEEPLPDDKIAALEQEPERVMAEMNNPPLDKPVILKDGTASSRVPQDILWMVAGDGFIGKANIRLELNEQLKNNGGHIGYGIRPSYRGRGFGKQILALALQYLQARGVEEALVTCRVDNTASAAVIEANGGVYKDTLDNPYGYGPTKRFYVPTTQKTGTDS